MSVEVPVSLRTRDAVPAPQVQTASSRLIPANPPAFPGPNTVFAEALPFIGMAGRLFMWACWLAEVVDDRIAARSDTGERLEFAVAKKLGIRAGWWVFSLLAALCCSLAAACLVPLFWVSSYPHLAPLAFLLVIFYFARRFGSLAGVVGTVGAALVFEVFLFEPRFSLAISSSAARNHLIWMVIAGICLSELLGHRKPPSAYRR
ncbi:MAG TPA: DUF4118 domain-containing protein [Terriglobales bacterium]|nr:DUF4118 domain-containing protein [Terriglobales bacterium]